MDSNFWSILPTVVPQLFERVRQTAQARSGAGATLPTRYTYSNSNGVAELRLSGVLLKYDDGFGAMTSTVAARETVRAMRTDPSVKAVLLIIDSPGGTVGGSYDLADEVAALSKVKPVTAFVEDLGASAAYLIASQARSISANRTALVGSIGTYSVVFDTSAQFASAGIRTVVTRSGQFKGAGVPGSPVTAAQEAEFQKVVDGLNGNFVTAVSTGRRMNRASVLSLADGRVFLAGEAVKNGLIDRVETLDDVRARARDEANGVKPAAAATSAQAVVGAGVRFMKFVELKELDGLSRLAAMGTVQQERPELHAAWLSEFNAEHVGKTRSNRR